MYKVYWKVVYNVLYLINFFIFLPLIIIALVKKRYAELTKEYFVKINKILGKVKNENS